MWAKIVGFVAGVFGGGGGASAAVRVAEKIAEKAAGVDWTPVQQADFILKYQEVTKYQSPMRRIIATAFTLEWLVLVNVWLVATIIGRATTDPDLMGRMVGLASDISAFMGSNINLTMSGIIGFYFLVGVKK